jgi:signal transduction histidine kinase
VVTIGGHSLPLLQQQGVTAVTLTLGIPSLLGVVLVGVGYATARRELVDAADATRLAGWVIAGMAVFFLVGVWITLLDVVLDLSVPYGALLTANAVTLGGVVGAVIGLYDAQSRKHTRELERSERELREQNERLDGFVSVVSHDLRSPLNVAQGRLELARGESTSDDLAAVARALDRMEELISDLLELARQSESGAELEPVELEPVVRRSWRTVRTEQATLEADLSLVVGADRSRLQQLLENLFRNSIDHGSTGEAAQSRTDPDDGTALTDGAPPGDGTCQDGENVTITVGELPDGTGFYVEDDGPGIPEAERAEVFEPGYSTRTDGTGFGLAIVKAVVEAHGWSIGVRTGQAGGARFEITGVDVER